MRNILVLNTSPRGQRSQSRKLVQLFIDRWRQLFPEDKIGFREVGQSKIPHITEEWIGAAFSAPDQRSEEEKQALSLSDELVAEFIAADIYIVGVPMHNWSIPSGFKAYIDQLMRINRTWKFKSGKPDGEYVGLLRNKKMFLIATSGDFGYQQGGINHHMNFQTPYLKTVFNIMGIRDITEITLENEEYGGKAFQESIEKTHSAIEQLFALQRMVS